VVLHPSVAERFTRCAPGLSPWRGGTLRTNLRFIGRRSCRTLYPAGSAAAPGSGLRRPTSPAQITGYLALADAQPALERRMRAAGWSAWARRRADPRRPARGARHRRRVPVRRRDRVVRGARPAGRCRSWPATTPGCWPRPGRRARADLRRDRSGRRNLTNPLISALDGGTGLPRLDTSRLRATWLADCAELLGLATFMHAAGISCSQRLGDLSPGWSPAGEAEAVRLLGAARRP
jgi:hypothetical protein